VELECLSVWLLEQPLNTEEETNEKKKSNHLHNETQMTSKHMDGVADTSSISSFLRQSPSSNWGFCTSFHSPVCWGKLTPSLSYSKPITVAVQGRGTREGFQNRLQNITGHQ
jgi:hypothetical protein